LSNWIQSLRPNECPTGAASRSASANSSVGGPHEASTSRAARTVAAGRCSERCGPSVDRKRSALTVRGDGGEDSAGGGPDRDDELPRREAVAASTPAPFESQVPMVCQKPGRIW
jgi:hypothetical protein